MKRKYALPVLVSAALISGLDLSMGGAALAAAPGAVVLPGTASPLAELAPSAGTVPAGTALKFDVLLSLPDRAAAASFAQTVSTPGDPDYGHYLTPSQWEAEFSPTQAEVTAVSSWLQSKGMTVEAVSGDRTVISVSATVGSIEQAFNTSISERRFAGHTLRTVDANISVPSTLAGYVLGTMGLSQELVRPEVTGLETSSASTSNAVVPANGSPTPLPPPNEDVPYPVCSTYFGQQVAPSNLPPYAGYPSPQVVDTCGYTPGEVRSAYGTAANLSSGDTGAGVKVAIVDAYASPTLLSDAQQYAANNDPAYPLSSSQFTAVYPSSYTEESECDGNSWFVEQSLDVEAVHAMAPGADIVYVGGQSCETAGLLGAIQDVVDNKLANIISDSWSGTLGDLLDPASEKTEYDDVFMQAAGEDISVLFATGDYGDDFTVEGVVGDNYPSSSPYVTAVGGTTLEIGSAGQRLAEYGWSTGISVLCMKDEFASNSDCTQSNLGKWLPIGYKFGSSGGASEYYAEPSYQEGTVPAADADEHKTLTGEANRVIPDISALGDPINGFLIGLTQTLPSGGTAYGQFPVGGTSVATPTMAGIFALADQKAGHALGFLNPTLYGLDAANPSAFYDVTAPASPSSEALATYINGYSDAEGPDVQTAVTTYEGTESYCLLSLCRSQDVTLTATPGYDNMTGIGSPGANFVSDVASYAGTTS